jgi:predicted ATPase
MLLQQITLKNVLSFKDTTVEFSSLNILIGANGAGKSNLIEAISLLQAAPVDFQSAILRGGGVRVWASLSGPHPSPIASLECRVLDREQDSQLLYHLQFSEEARGLVLIKEWLRSASGGEIYFDRTQAHVSFGSAPPSANESGGLPLTESVLASFRSPIDTTPITRIGREFERIRIFREFMTGPTAQSRHGISASVPKAFLNETGDNLALVLQELDFRGALEDVRRYLRRLSDRFRDVKVRLDSGIAKAYLWESGLIEPLPAVRVSDGTLKFLCLLAVLLHPDPPPLICIEEPEIGLHPDALRIVAEALIEASERTQLIVTTHSEALVDAMSEKPESVLVCERDFDNSTQFKRLSMRELDAWLEKYTLGELWKKGEIGGTRW